MSLSQIWALSSLPVNFLSFAIGVLVVKVVVVMAVKAAVVVVEEVLAAVGFADLVVVMIGQLVQLVN
ncbi:hypothetical protein G9A89_019439 [Geosiphon pyriformis]|nr:hypothetical protein G9A89_019439 [Geosiphon pyriformis]